MLFSYKKLKELASLESTTKVEDVIVAINSIGFEVEGTHKFGDVEGIKFGKVLSVEKNPNADTLNVCEIEFDDKTRVIQTNATNVVEGMYVIAFVPGSKMGDITFAAKEMQGVVSDGMLSSLNELGADKDLLRDGATDGIQAYPEVDLSTDPIEYLGLQDTIIDIDILSNRSDALSYIVMARELAAYFGTTPKELETNSSNLESNIKVTEGNHKELAFIEAKNDFTINLDEQLLLVKGGIKSIDNIVDLTNLTLIMTGQPTHAYDKNNVGNEFSSTLSSDKVNLLGNKEVELKDDLVITSNGTPVSMAGVMGFEKTGVSKDTNDFILELGRFNIKEVRKALKTIKMNSQAGIQSSKIISNGTTKLANKYISSKLNTFSNTVNLNDESNKEVEFSTRALSQVAGFDITKTDRYAYVLKALKTLGYIIKENSIEVPSYRHDINTQQDLNEEFLRFYGYDNIEPVAPKMIPSKVHELDNTKEVVANKGYDEAITYTLISEEKNKYNPFNFDNSIKLETYVSKEREVIRNSQIASILEVVEYNQKRNMKDLSIFSEGMINDGYKSVILASTIKSFMEMKQDIVSLLPNNVEFVKTTDAKMHPGVSADIMLDGKKIGYIGKVNPKETKLDLFVAEYLTSSFKKTIKFNAYDNSPLKTRDVTYELEPKENISSFIKDVDCMEAKVIDEFLKDGINKVTVRFTGNDEQIKNIG